MTDVTFLGEYFFSFWWRMLHFPVAEITFLTSGQFFGCMSRKSKTVWQYKMYPPALKIFKNITFATEDIKFAQNVIFVMAFHA